MRPPYIKFLLGGILVKTKKYLTLILIQIYLLIHVKKYFKVNTNSFVIAKSAFDEFKDRSLPYA